MPELPEVETVRAGLGPMVTRCRIEKAEVLHPRPVRKHDMGPADFALAMEGRIFDQPMRRGKYLWFPFTDGDALIAHLGMSGQFRVNRPGDVRLPHTRVVFTIMDATDTERELRFVDQRMFGGLQLSPGGAVLPDEIAHIAVDPFDPAFNLDEVAERMRRRRTTVKRALLDQGLVSGIGNIYADEALWEAGIHPELPTEKLTRKQARELLLAAQTVMRQALEEGGTSFDSLYVHVNGESGYFDRALNVYGQDGLPCPRCGTVVVRQKFTNRSSHLCPKCQKLPRSRGAAVAKPVQQSTRLTAPAATDAPGAGQA